MQNLVGQTVADRYRVEEFLGRGGMAEVYKVWDQRRATYLAMKLLHEDLALDRVFIRRCSTRILSASTDWSRRTAWLSCS
jgi:serine/threonine-protein kinase